MSDPDQVVCTYSGPWAQHQLLPNGAWLLINLDVVPHPLKDGVYTIVGTHVDLLGTVGYLLAEVPDPHGGAGWATAYFRPVRRTSIELLRQALVPKPEFDFVGHAARRRIIDKLLGVKQ